MLSPKSPTRTAAVAKSRPRLARATCVVAAVPLLLDALFLMGLGVFSLGVTLPLAIACALLVLAWRWHVVHAWIDAAPKRRHLWRWMWALFWLWVLSVACFWIALARPGDASRNAASGHPAVIVVLGSGTPGGKVSPVLAARLDAALQRAQAVPRAIVVASGGVDFGQTRSEGEIMGDYLRAKGLPAARILQEERSTSTEENLLFSRALLEGRGIRVAQADVEIVTSDFHTLRSSWIARRAGYANVHAVGAPTPLYVRYNAWLREYFAVLSGLVLREF